MKKLFALLLALVMVLSLTACGGGRTEAAAPAEKPAEAAGEEAAAPVEAAGIEAGATIGVSLPWLGTQNWKEAEEMFKTELEAAGFKP
ncbi:MAG: sugar ABC transporter substrate-binding protein, partial [Oscillospiraceae bacterium]|nr:sugar ABC transporter substrate-binding protein [Oscillospiraceae bacterium]